MNHSDGRCSGWEVADEIDGNEDDSIAICGFSLKFPQDATSPESFWDMLMQKRCATTRFPSNRMNADGFQGAAKTFDEFPSQGAHFINEDLSLFDAGFFSISPTEAAALDPMQRWLLETAYRALENAGIPMAEVAGSSTAVYTGSFNMDYTLQLARDAEFSPTYAALGIGLSMLANRLSWFFNLHGPSVGLDSACSSSAMAVDIACQALRNSSCDMVRVENLQGDAELIRTLKAMVAGCNLLFSPEYFSWMTKLNFLSPDSRCYSFDHRANGYARGEGIGVLILKRLGDAIRDGNTIRAVIRSSRSNEDGRTPGITQPSQQAQENLIRDTYQKAGLSMSHTRYFEAHGTGTALGDPLEAQAMGLAFQKYRSVDDPLFVGAVKSNIGHLEGASCIASIIKAVLALEKGIIPPNANFEKVNPRIDTELLALKFPEEAHSWPTRGLRRASVNSFGYGGANTHIVLDDAYNYLNLRNLPGKHRTRPSLTRPHSDDDVVIHIDNTALGASEDYCDGSCPPKLLVWSTADKNGLDRIAEAFESHEFDIPRSTADRDSFLHNLAYTLDSHRSHLPWRSFSVVESPSDLENIKSRMTSPIQTSTNPPRVGYVFSGQGAQWPAMGKELMSYSSFSAELDQASHFLKGLGCQWSVTDELLKEKGASRIDHPEFSQTLSTVLQVAMVNLLSAFGLHPASVVGHSSGEIAAAYAAGYISSQSAWKLAYLRGLVSSELSKPSKTQPTGAMIAVGSSEEDLKDLVATINEDARSFGLSIACINSPRSVTVAGEESLVDRLQSLLHERNVFARKLRVAVAYHTPQMSRVSAKYSSMIGSLSEQQGSKQVRMISTVTGETVAGTELRDSAYWTANMESPVQFSSAVRSMCAHSGSERDRVNTRGKGYNANTSIDYLVEIGPHATLRGPIREILLSLPHGDSVKYGSLLRRGESAMITTLTELGNMHSSGVLLHLRAINEPSGGDNVSRSLLVSLPEYPFDHSQGYWHESRVSRNYRLRECPPSQFLGVRSRDWNPSDARWRHFLRAADNTWVEDHVINGTTLYPAGGMLAMAIEALGQLKDHSDRSREGYVLRDVSFQNPIDLSMHSKGLEVQTCLLDVSSTNHDEPFYEFRIQSCSSGNDWTVNCRGLISAEISETSNQWLGGKVHAQRQGLSRRFTTLLSNSQLKPVDSRHMYEFLERECGYQYGPQFRVAQHQAYDGESKLARAEVSLFEPAGSDKCVIHPVSLDALFHLHCTALTLGGTKAIPTCIPTHIDYIWVSSQGLSARPESDAVQAVTAIDAERKRGFSCSGMASTAAGPGDIRLWYQGLELTSVASPQGALSASHSPAYLCMHIDTKPSLEKMRPRELLTLLEQMHPAAGGRTRFYADLERLVEASLEMFCSSVDPTAIRERDPWRLHYWNWANRHLGDERRTRSRGEVELAQSFDELLDRVKNANHIGRVYAEVASNLLGIFSGDVDVLELLVHPGFLGKCYEEILSNELGTRIASYVDLLAHQSPGLSILEVGGGTGSGTRALVQALCSRPGGETLRCNRYDFTDVSPAFLDQARAEFKSFSSQMSFGTLDIEKDFAEQGYDGEDYDVVIAVSVLHISSDLAGTLQRLRKALKPGGKLILQESFTPSGWTLGYVFGLFPGWWFGVQDGRTLSPSISVDAWHALLEGNGFSGVDLVLDPGQECPVNCGWIVSTATATTPLQVKSTPIQPTSPVAIVVDPNFISQHTFAKELSTSLYRSLGVEPTIRSIEEHAASCQEITAEMVIFLADYEHSYLASLTEEKWLAFKSLIHRSRSLLWVNAGGGRNVHPDHGMLDGLARTLRLEHYELHLVTLALDGVGSIQDHVSHVIRVAVEMRSRSPHTHYEQDYVEVDGILHTRRLVEAPYLTSDIAKKVSPYEVVPTLVDSNSRFTVSSEYSGLDTPSYVRTIDPPEQLGIDSLEISVKAIAVEYHDDSQFLACQRSRSFGRFCSGIVVGARNDAAFCPGDRVFAVADSAFHSHIRLPSSDLFKIPISLSFVDACWAVSSISAAYHALVEVGRARSADSILVHGGAAPAGQAAIQILVQQGVDVWTSVADDDQNSWIVENFDIPSEHVLPKTWFDRPSVLSSQYKQQFDIILSVDEPSSNGLFMGHMKSGGHYILLHTSPHSFKRQGSRVLRDAPGNTSLTIIDFSDTIPSKESLSYAITNVGIVAPKISKDQITEFPASSLTNAFSRLRSSTNKGPVVATLDDGDVIDVIVPAHTTYKLHPEATYLVSGGFGGLGREMVTWLVSRGARYLILLSRSGAQKPESLDLLTRLKKNGVRVEAPCCDVSSAVALRTVIVHCSKRMPPIRGCIQASMVMTESLFDEMTFKNWKTAIDPKVQGSWNLHTELPNDLDFFILFSSAMGILGTGLLSAYNSGNTYQDALARYRVSQGERAAAIDLSAVADRGYVAEHERYKVIFERNRKLAPLAVKEICALLDIYCDPKNTAMENLDSCQSVIGINHPVAWNLEDEPYTMTQPFWGHVHHIPLPPNQDQQQDDSANKAKSKKFVDLKIRLNEAESVSAAGNIVSEALVGQISTILGTPEDRIDVQKPMHVLGIDSLASISVRNWINKTFDVDMPVFEIMGGASIANVGATIAQKLIPTLVAETLRPGLNGEVENV